MEIHKEVRFGHYTWENMSQIDVMSFLSRKKCTSCRIALTLADYLVKHSKTFKNASFLFTNEKAHVHQNGTLGGLVGYLNRAEVDVVPQPFKITDNKYEGVNYVYPFNIIYATFMIRKPEYQPEIFGIFKTISFPVWIIIFAVSIFMFLSYHFILKGKYAFHKVLLHVLAILLRQGSILIPSSASESILMYSWVVGAMLLCLAYDSVFLSFLTFPPVMKIKDVSQLAAAVEKGEYHCISTPGSFFIKHLIISDEKKLRIIGKNLQKVTLTEECNLEDFINDRCKQNYAFVGDDTLIDYIDVGKKFVSDDKFLGIMGAMVVRKDFCCKNVLETFVHRLMASGMFIKFKGDAKFLIQLPTLLAYEEKYATKRKLTLTDVAPAFIFLLAGYFISCLVFIYELISNRMKHLNTREGKKRK